MGNGSSKDIQLSNWTENVDHFGVQEVHSDGYDNENVIYFNKRDRHILHAIKSDLNNSPEMFVLNNVLMGVMFFENYKRDIDEFSQKRSTINGDFLEPDLILEKVFENVRYRPFHGPKKYSSEPVTSRRLFIFNEFVKVVGSMESVEDTDHNNDKSIVRIEESQKKGFVKLREIQPTLADTDGYIPISTSASASASTSRSSTDSDSTNAYATVTEMKTPHPIDINRSHGYQETDIMRNACITYRKVKKLSSEIYFEDRCIEDITEDELYDIVSYINSKAFMKHFQNNIFPNRTAALLGFNQEEINLSQAIPGKIFCYLNDVPVEVVPAIPTSWPSEQTLDFIMKSERTPVKRKQLIFPTPSMIGEIKSMNCALIPRGYYKKNGERLDSAIEWELSFPQAQMYLESFMSHAQMKCLLILLTIHKNSIAPKTGQLGLLPEHIRCFMIWECESNYTDWPEHRLGIKLLEVIKNFNAHIAKAYLPDYFIKERNLFENVQKKYLRFAQKVFHDILESPLMTLMRSLRCLRYANGKSFYPPFDFDKVYEILTKSGMEDSNLIKNAETSKSPETNPPIQKKQRYVDSDIQWKHILEAKQRERILTKKMERRESVDSINVDWECEQQLDVHKKRALLHFFINTFIQIEKKCSQISSKKQTLFYLKQAKYLTNILKQECAIFEDETGDLLQVIDNEEKTLEESMKNDSSLPTKTVEFDNNIAQQVLECCDSDELVDKNAGRKSVTFEVEVHNEEPKSTLSCD